MPKITSSSYSETLPKQKEVVVKSVWKKIGVVLGAVISNGGTGYINETNVSTVGGSGPQDGQFNCKVNITTSGGVVTDITIASGGIGYTLNDMLIVLSATQTCTFKANPVST